MLPSLSFAGQNAFCFVPTSAGVLVLPKTPSQEYARLEKEVLKNLRDCGSGAGLSPMPAACSYCGSFSESSGGFVSLCSRGHDSFVCYNCIARRNRESPYDEKKGFCPECDEEKMFLTEKCKDAIERALGKCIERGEHPRQPSAFSPGALDKDVVLTENTEIFLRDISISDEFFLVLLAKTRIEAVENMSLFKQDDSRSCFGEPDTGEDRPTSLIRRLGRYSEESSLVLENIRKIPQKSIRCLCEDFSVENSSFLGILPKLDLCEENVFRCFVLGLQCETDIAELFECNKVSLGKVRTMRLTDYAVPVLPFLVFHKENVFRLVDLESQYETKMAGLFEDSKIRLGKVRKLVITDYAVLVLPLLAFHKENVFESFVLRLHSELNIAGFFRGNKVSLGKVRTMKLTGSAVSVLPFLVFHEENVFESVVLEALYETKTDGLGEFSTIYLGKVRKLVITDYAVLVLPLLAFHKENVFESFEMDSFWKANLFELFRHKNKNAFGLFHTKSINIGKIREKGLRVPDEIKKHLNYTNVDEKGNSVVFTLG
ncbi:MAG: uncharacterized protein A8A55_1317 [Amphiamblys sp. WSBS2006]|nr:MAG: uncharacterized protein A8A55_1317 [Amphiamblys sp. WSBS2006]